MKQIDPLIPPKLSQGALTKGQMVLFDNDQTMIQTAFQNVDSAVDDIKALDDDLLKQYESTIVTDDTLNRRIVSYQASKAEPEARWYKFKEAFSSALVNDLLRRWSINEGTLLDPFAGSGTALFAATRLGLSAKGIELLPIGIEIIKARKIVRSWKSFDLVGQLTEWCSNAPWRTTHGCKSIQSIAITCGAYPNETEKQLGRYLYEAGNADDSLKTVLQFALLCVLESISFTRKDGQYLRWDFRSGRRPASAKFSKGPILEFDAAITGKLLEILADIQHDHLFDGDGRRIEANCAMKIDEGSCLELLPNYPESSFDTIFTSPPYCNRYDYTRTYALELALLGTDEDALKRLRQRMLSCTVENRAKDLLELNPAWKQAVDAANNQQLLQSILNYLDQCRENGLLNNTGIARMVRGYFYEMACVIQECYRVLKPNAKMFMVNDNVRYAGVGISVDLILTNIAEMLGFKTEAILILPISKGNSSQQMGEHGREKLRKCVYVWRKSA